VIANGWSGADTSISAWAPWGQSTASTATGCWPKTHAERMIASAHRLLADMADGLREFEEQKARSAEARRLLAILRARPRVALADYRGRQWRPLSPVHRVSTRHESKQRQPGSPSWARVRRGEGCQA